jgi:hypothetical protein
VGTALGLGVEGEGTPARDLGRGQARGGAQRDGPFVGGDGEREEIAGDGGLRAESL